MIFDINTDKQSVKEANIHYHQSTPYIGSENKRDTKEEPMMCELHALQYAKRHKTEATSNSGGNL